MKGIVGFAPVYLIRMFLRMKLVNDMNEDKAIETVLSMMYWPKELKTNSEYFRTQDDCDGDLSNGLSVTIDIMGDVWVTTTKNSCRFRMTAGGGGLSPAVRNALLVLAMAIEKDNKENKMGRA